MHLQNKKKTSIVDFTVFNLDSEPPDAMMTELQKDPYFSNVKLVKL